ncbi:hypothetical protein J6590_102140, partial [Homalodisca vitripennis]
EDYGYNPLKMRILQLNHNHCKAAQDLLAQTVGELNKDVLQFSQNSTRTSRIREPGYPMLLVA